MFPALAGGFLNTAPPGKSLVSFSLIAYVYASKKPLPNPKSENTSLCFLLRVL